VTLKSKEKSKIHGDFFETKKKFLIFRKTAKNLF